MLQSFLLTFAIAIIIILILRRRKIRVDAKPVIKDIDAKAVSVEVQKHESKLSKNRK